MAKNAELSRWKEMITVSDRFFKPQMKKLDLYMEYYSSNQWHDEPAMAMYHNHPVDNMLYANIRVIVPRLNFRNPKIFVTPRKKPFRTENGIIDTTSAAVGIEILLNYWYKELKSKRETKRCLYDALIGSYGVMEVGYTLETEKVGKKGDLLVVDELIMADSPYMVRRSPRDVRWDIEARDSALTDARWISLDWVLPLDDVKKNPRYSNTRGLKPNFNVKTDPKKKGRDDETGTGTDDSFDNPHLWERVKGRDIWDKKTQTVYTYVEGHDKFIRKEEWPLFYDGGFPIDLLFFNELPDQSIPLADFDIYKKAQDELNQMRSLTLEHMRRISQRRVFAEKDNLDSDAMRDYEHGPDGVIVLVNNVDKIKNASDPTISQDMYIGISQMKSSIRENSGVSPTEALAATKFEQATEPALLEKASTTIREDQRDTFEGFIVRNVTKLGKVLQQVMPETDIPLNTQEFEDARELLDSKLYKIVGEESTAIFPWLTLSKEDIEGDYNYDIEVGSTQAVNQETRKNDIVAMSKLLGGSPYIKQREANVRVVEAFGEKDVDRLIKTDEEVEQDKQQAQQAAQQPSPDQQLKTQADLKKTEQKTATSVQVANIKAESEKEKTVSNLLAASLKNMDKKGNRE